MTDPRGPVAHEPDTVAEDQLAALREQNARLRTQLEWTAMRLRDALAGSPIRDADEVLEGVRTCLRETP